MFSLKQDALLLSLRSAEGAEVFPPAEDRRAWEGAEPAWRERLTRRADRALKRDAPVASAAMYRAGGYRKGSVFRREMIKALSLGACARGDARYAEKLSDLLMDLCEESDWCLNELGRDYPDADGGKLDLNALETAALITICVRLCEGQLRAVSPRVLSRVKREAERRVTEVFLRQEGENFLSLREEELPRGCAAAMSYFLLGEEDERRRWLCLRRVLRLLEGYLQRRPADGGLRGGLSAQLEAALAVDDCFYLLNRLSGSELELRDEPLFVNMAAFPCSLHIDEGWFVNPGGDSMKPALSPDSLFRLGEDARLNALCALAAYLRRFAPEPAEAEFDEETEPLLQQLMTALYRRSFLREPARSPRRSWEELPATGFLSARTERFYAALSGGDNLSENCHLDAGEVILFLDGKPVFIDPGLGPSPLFHSVPALPGAEQQRKLPGASDAQARAREGYTLLSMDLTRAYPAAAGLQAWQRSVLLSEENGARIMDVFDFDSGKGRAILRFICAERPELSESGARIGPLEARWDAILRPRVEEIPLSDPAKRALWGERLYRLELETAEAVSGGSLTVALLPIH